MTTETKKIKACIFDAYGTLFNVHAAAERCKPDLGEHAASISQLWRQKQLEYTWLRSLMRDYKDFWSITKDALDYALEAHQIDNPALKEKLLNLYWELDAYPEVPQVLETLRQKGIKTAILTNGTFDMIEAAVSSAKIGPFLNEIHSVEELKIYKPDPRVYQLSVDHLYLDPKEICFISSNAWDVSGAAYFGFNVVWVNRFNQPKEKLSGKPISIEENLKNLPDLITL